MSITMVCPHCGKGYTLADTQAGKTVRCKSCGEPFPVRAAGAARKPALPDEDGDDRPARRGRADNEEDRRSRRRDEEDDAGDELRPRRRRKKGSAKVWLWVCLGSGGALLVVGLVVLLVLLRSSNDTGANDKKPSEDMGVTVASYKKLKANMSEQQVVAILGKPTQEESSSGGVVHTLVWKGGDNYQVECKFLDHKLVNWGASIGGRAFLQDQESGR